MTTPAGWYDDGSGRQRWWDGQQWTEHFAPEAAAPEAPVVADAPAVAHTPAVEETAADSLDDTVIRTTSDTYAPPAAAAEPDAQVEAPFVAPNETAATTPISDGGVPPYAAGGAYPASAPADPGYQTGAPGYAAPAYPAAAPAYPGAAPAGAPGAYAVADAGPKKPSVLGLVGLGLAVLGTILVFIPLVGVFGFVLLGIGFILSLVSLFLKGKKWPGIAGLSLAVVGTIIGIVMSFVYLFAFAEGVQSEMDDFPTSIPTEAAPDPDETDSTTDETSAGRPTVEEVSEGLTEILTLSGQGETYTPEQVTCISEAFVASDIDDDTLRVIANGDEMFQDADALTAFTDEFTSSGVTCLMQ
ncbi:DUF2510 domain-containing protein [Microbacterium sp. LWH12-1.2]|uniref:DUF2510 domain-containing protein n=1 Tax=Microbacterium sp. LWH12-1.2 TaxID=3135259 RepID=UPI0034470278